MFERFTDRARRAILLAQEDARALGHTCIGTEHLLLGLLHEGEGVAVQVLRSSGIEYERVQGLVREILGEGEEAPGGHLPFADRAKRVMEMSLREAVRLRNNYIGTKHLLLGLLREGEGFAAQLLVRLGFDRQQALQRIAEALGRPEDPHIG